MSDNNAPEIIYRVSESQFSVSRYYGGCKAFGHNYHYDANSDSLVRLDIWQDQIRKADKLVSKYSLKEQRDKWIAEQYQFDL